MLPLSNLQQQFFDSFQSKETEGFTPYVSSQNASSRLEIYHHSIAERLIKALSITFPRIFSLVGTQYGNHIAQEFLYTHLPDTGCLEDWGESFPPYIAEAAQLRYLRDVGQLEWLIHLSFNHAVPRDAHTSRFDNATPKRRRPDPSCYLLESLYPLREILMIADEDPEATSLDLASYHPSTVVITAEDLNPTLHWMERPIFNIIRALYTGENMRTLLHRYPKTHVEAAREFIVTHRVFAEAQSD